MGDLLPAFSPPAKPGTSSARSIDRAGNIDGAPESRTWTVQAQSSCAAKTVTTKASADSSVYQKTPARSVGTDPVLRVNPRNGERTRSLLRFDMPTIPAGCQVLGYS